MNEHNQANDQVINLELEVLQKQLKETQYRENEARDQLRQLGDLLVEVLASLNWIEYDCLAGELKESYTMADVLIEHAEELASLFTDPVLAMEREIDALRKAASAHTTRQLTPEPASQPRAEQRPPQACTHPPPKAAIREQVSENVLSVLELVHDTGEFLKVRLVELVNGLPWAETMSAESCQAKTFEHLESLQALGWVEQHPLTLRTSDRVRERIGSYAVALTGAGKAACREAFGAEPLDRFTPFRATYDSLEAGVLIRFAQDILERWNGRSGCRWTCEVIDVARAPDEAFERIAGAGRFRPSTSGSAPLWPDLVLRMQPPSGKAHLAVVEVSTGEYTLHDLRTRWDRALRHYPPAMIYVLAPCVKARNALYREWIGRVKTVKARHGLPHGANAAFYTLDELMDTGLLSAKQLVGITLRKRDARGPERSPEDTVRLPKYWCEPKG